MPPPTDNELITQARQESPADRAAFAELVRRHSPALLRYLGNLLPRRDMAEDVAQEVFLAVWCHRERFDPQRGSFAAWMFTIARHRAYNRCRGEKRPQAEMAMEMTPMEMTPTAQPGPDRELAVKEAYAALDRALAQIPFDQRSVFVLAEIQGFAMGEIASIEGLPVGTVKSRLARARRKMKARLKKIGDLLDE